MNQRVSTLAASCALVLVTGIAIGLRGQSPAGAALGDRLPLEGLASSGAGLALWNTGPGGREAEQVAHPRPWTPCSDAAPAYAATRDYDDLDADAATGLQGLATVVGFPGLVGALTTNGFSVTDVTASWTAQSLGDDLQDTDWLFDEATGIETLYFQGGTFGMQLNGEALVGGAMATTAVRIDYLDRGDCTDDAITLRSDPLVLKDTSADSSAPVQAVAAALIADLAGHGLRVVVDGASATERTITTGSRTGTVVDVTSAHLEVAAVCSCPIGIASADSTHEWTVRWPEATLPEQDPLQLKIVAETLAAPPEGESPGRLTVTVFDERAPSVGTILDVTYPDARGTNEAFVELDLLQGTDYRFTIQHSGAGRHYRVGASPETLRLGQSDQRYLPARSQDWAIDVAANENVILELATDAEAGGSTQATSAIVTVFDLESYDRVHGPVSLSFTPDTPQTVSFVNAADARRLLLQVEPDGEFRMKKTGGDALLYSLACPLRDGPTIPTLTITDDGVTPTTVSVAVGGQVFMTNQRSTTHVIQSNPHPIHTDCPPLNALGSLTPGAGLLSGVFDVEATCGFHDHLNPGDGSLQGSVVVGGGGAGTGPDEGDGGAGGGPDGGGGGYLLPQGTAPPHAHP